MYFYTVGQVVWEFFWRHMDIIILFNFNRLLIILVCLCPVNTETIDNSCIVCCNLSCVLVSMDVGFAVN